MVACRRDNFVAKEPGFEPADFATNVYSLNRRAVRLKPEDVTRQIRHDIKGLIITFKKQIIDFNPDTI
jgi:hypothetical protein